MRFIAFVSALLLATVTLVGQQVQVGQSFTMAATPDRTAGLPQGYRWKINNQVVLEIPEANQPDIFMTTTIAAPGDISITVEAYNESGAASTPPFIVSVLQSNPPINCIVSEWSAWSEWTTVSPTQETRMRTRTVLTQPANGGTACPNLMETEVRTIIPPPVVLPCPYVTPTGTSAPVAVGGVVQGWNTYNYDKLADVQRFAARVAQLTSWKFSVQITQINKQKFQTYLVATCTGVVVP